MKVTKTYTSASTDVDETPCPSPTPLARPNPCEVSDLPDGSVIITLRVDAHIIKRHRLRANGMEIGRYLWENILHRAMVDSVY